MPSNLVQAIDQPEQGEHAAGNVSILQESAPPVTTSQEAAPQESAPRSLTKNTVASALPAPTLESDKHNSTEEALLSVSDKEARLAKSRAAAEKAREKNRQARLLEEAAAAEAAAERQRLAQLRAAAESKAAADKAAEEARLADLRAAALVIGEAKERDRRARLAAKDLVFPSSTHSLAEAEADFAIETSRGGAGAFKSGLNEEGDAVPVDEVKGIDMIALKAFKAFLPVQMTFDKDDTICVIDNTGKWFRGILKRSKYEITNQVLFVPSNLVRAIEQGSSQVSSGRTQDLTSNVSAPAVSLNSRPRSNTKGGTVSEASLGGKVQTRKTMVALRSFKASRAVQMSFDKGDIIDIVDYSGKWFRGILVRSTSHEITNRVLLVPSNLVREVKKSSQ